MESLLNTSGSIWRKWDLHIHTPESVLHSEYSGNWDLYLETLENLTDFSVIGITDYFSIEGYKKIKKFREDGRVQNIDLIIPNIELRLDKTTHRGKPINIHILFDPEIDPEDIESYFLGELEFKYQDAIYKCVRRDLIGLGEIFLNEEYSEEKALRSGMKQFKVSIEMIDKVLKKHRSKFHNKYLIVVPNSNVDGNSGLRDDSFLAVRRQIYHFSDMIFSSNPRDREFFLGETDMEKTIEQCGKIMPCIHGSDAHSFEKIGSPDDDRFTWIKSEPTFEGLKQIVHEPKSRVIIQTQNPDQKNDYDVISSISFQSDTNVFSKREIQLNPGLNTIIGGKSSGKSLLLYKIAQSISKQEIEVREKEELWRNPYTNTFIEETEFEVKWRNGSTTKNNSDEQIGKVTYIPQMYINSLSEDTANDVLQEKIISILLQNSENSTFMDEKKDELNHNKRKKTEAITNLFEYLENKNEILLDIDKIGDERSVQLEITKLEADIKEKIALSELNDDDEKYIEEKEELKSELQKDLESINFKSIYTQKAEKRLDIIYDQVNENIKQIDQIDEDLAVIFEQLRQEISESFIKAHLNMQKRLSRLDGYKVEVDEKVSLIQDLLDPLIKKAKNREEIQHLRSKLEIQKKSLTQILKKRDKLNSIDSQIESIINGLIGFEEESLRINRSILEHFNNSDYLNDIKINTKITFKDEFFEENFLSKFVRRGRMSNTFPRCDDNDVFSTDGFFIFDEENFIDKIKFLLLSILQNDESKLKKGYSKKQAIQALFENYIEVIFDLKKDNDSLSEMSPGKRGLVLIELFLNISDESHPILIDQPEDNLDNRTITTDLVKFIRDKSLNRQIIIVTHNANLVVLTDSENVIVANQDPQLIQNEHHRFEYINGALECDFNTRDNTKISSKGIRSHVCEILEGGVDAFSQREKKYGFSS
ncbi:TrlF family AAA-like ATPase [Neobacillus vireti]|uniref:TrlF family AAA-like ATPase n=1 Tax=Neobacillus vireti TaxID=220686 RepID=UPI002FFF32F5